jgi:hypothetical protein
LYVGVNQFCAGGRHNGTSAFVIRKTSAMDAGPLVVTAFHNSRRRPPAPVRSPHGVDNDDPAAAFGALHRRRQRGVRAARHAACHEPCRRADALRQHPDSGRRDSGADPRPSLGNLGGTDGQPDGGDDRIASAKIKNGGLWAVQTIGVTETGQASASANRHGVRWYEIQALDTAPSIAQSGTLHSTDAPGTPDARNYWVPSIAATGRGRAVIGFSAAGTQEYVNAGAVDRVAGDPAGTLQPPVLYTTSVSSYNPSTDPGSATRGRRWGGYSRRRSIRATTTRFGRCSSTPTPSIHALQVGRVVGPPPAALTSASPFIVPAAALDQRGHHRRVSQQFGVFDPGAGFVPHLRVD